MSTCSIIWRSHAGIDCSFSGGGALGTSGILRTIAPGPPPEERHDDELESATERRRTHAGESIQQRAIIEDCASMKQERRRRSYAGGTESRTRPSTGGKPDMAGWRFRGGRRLKSLEDENRGLKKLLAEAMMDMRP
jgi:hypothetical protein